jgi:hypothetical protein
LSRAGFRNALIGVAVFFSSGWLAAGPTFTVNSPGDAADAAPNGICATAGGACTLRAAVMEANATSGALIVIPAGTYTLSVTPSGADDATSGDLNVTSSMTIKGAGVGVTVIEAATLGDSAFRIESGGSLDISGLTIQHASGRSDGVSSAGGTFLVVTGGTLNVSDARIYLSTVGGTAGKGGALYVAGTATLTRTVIDSCSATGDADPVGGGIFNNGGSLTLDRCTLTGCTAAGTGYGGAIATNSVTRIVASTLTNNTAVYGGAISNGGGTCTFINSTVSGNKSYGDGGGINASMYGQVHLYNTTVINNRSDLNATGSGNGGGIWSQAAGDVSLQNSVLAYNLSTAGTMHSLVNEDCYGTIAANGRNLLTFTTNCSVTGVFSVGDPFLYAELADNGGPTLTHALAGGGAAVDKGDPLGCTDDLAAPITTDQRGVHRPIGPACDLGSFELEPIGDANGDGQRDVADVFYLINYLFAGGPIPLGRANVNGDGTVDISDVFYLINYLFAGGPAPL